MNIAEFHHRINRDGDDGCWSWLGATTKAGYGHLRYEGKQIYAHRLMCLLLGLSIDGKVVMHTCDNPGCVNPKHLRVGTQIDNIRDRDAKGRHGCFKLTYDDAEEIRNLYRYGNSGILSERYNVSKNTISDIVHHKRYKQPLCEQ